MKGWIFVNDKDGNRVPLQTCHITAIWHLKEGRGYGFEVQTFRRIGTVGGLGCYVDTYETVDELWAKISRSQEGD
jgi:hypothetical protein